MCVFEPHTHLFILKEKEIKILLSLAVEFPEELLGLFSFLVE
jgi:hypothetical protein